MSGLNTQESHSPQNFAVSGGLDRRRYRRVPVSFKGRLMAGDRREYPCEVISAGGMAIVTPAACQPGKRIVAYLDSVGRLEGTVARTFEAALPLRSRRVRKSASESPISSPGTSIAAS